jgi:hypothetical protein
LSDCANPEGTRYLNVVNVFNEYEGWGVFPPDTDLRSFGEANGDMRFFVRSEVDAKVEIQCTGPVGPIPLFLSGTNWIAGPDWQEISIPLCDFFGGTCTPDALTCLESVQSPFLITYEGGDPGPGLISFDVDYVRWHTPNSHTGASSVEVQGRELLVDGQPFAVNGVAYQPISVGENWQGAWTDRADRYLIDFPQIAASGANTVRLYAPIITTAMLDAAWAEGLYVIPTYTGVNLGQLQCPEGRTFMGDRLEEMVLDWKDHPSILFWLIGNEFNTDLSATERCDSATGWYPQLDDLAQRIKAIDPNHPVGTANSDTVGLADICEAGCSTDTALPNLDIWGLQIYRGCTLGSAFSQYEAKADCSKPLVITEFGADAWNSASFCSVSTGTTCFVNTDCPAGTCSVTTTTACHTSADCPGSETCVGGEFCDGAGAEDQTMQANCFESLLADADQALALRTGGVSSGQVVFEWADEWWKAECLPTTDWAAQDTCASSANFGYTMDPAINEEWWGIVGVDAVDPDARNVRAAYTTLGDAWLGAACDMRVGAHDPGSGNTTITFNPAAGNAVSHNLYYGPLSAVSSYGYSGAVTGVDPTGSTSVTLPSGELFWVVAAENGVAEEGCYGLDSAGVQRPCFSGNCDVDQISGWNCLCGTP